MPKGNAFAHGVRDSLADYLLNPLRATKDERAGTLSDDILPGQNYLFRKLGVSQASIFTILMKDRMYISGDCIPCVLTLQHQHGVCRNIANCGSERITSSSSTGQ
ncbi:hypothetical protein J6590_049342 [Homalodisca vitripennis]|nr:hypothetical protein J6590_049342 [Homalodisca vitripennis]